ncbi:MAG: hypothetical protein AAFX95_16505 [Cyanobacteria bacterium J06639_16]
MGKTYLKVEKDVSKEELILPFTKAYHSPYRSLIKLSDCFKQRRWRNSTGIKAFIKNQSPNLPGILSVDLEWVWVTIWRSNSLKLCNFPQMKKILTFSSSGAKPCLI